MTTTLGRPSGQSAVIVRVHLPAGLERLRRSGVGDADVGVPAHMTMLYPFVAPERLDAGVRRDLAGVAAAHAPIAYRLTGPARWPDTIYAAVDPAGPFVRLQADLEATLPGFPVYGPDRAFAYEPHVTIAEGARLADDRLVTDPAWAALPRPAAATHLEVIARPGRGRWRTAWRIRLGGLPASTRR